MSFRLGLFLSFLLSIQTVHARESEGSISGGGGGTVVICQAKNGDFKRIDLLDYILALEYFTASRPRRLRSDLLALNNHEQILAQLYSELKNDSDFLVAKYIPMYAQFFIKNATFKKGLSLKNPDINEAIISTIKNKPYCKPGEKTIVRLAAIQDFAKNSIQIDSEIWNHPAFGEFGKAALIFHEGWYAYFYAKPIARPELPTPVGPEYIYSNVSEYLLEDY